MFQGKGSASRGSQASLSDALVGEEHGGEGMLPACRPAQPEGKRPITR
ncbi:Hypothetical protein CAP_0499 [Chondromyces apiculatus DSM 436]|uniref:Uncharacterized protein n=1 Tax=Chondromyces apiculatus DSM 436 TaxID=1192034 RepID=A0A017SUT1_9BACT|nr:Hypothetical protein CAP_0499 [Chondromyces apiculatus DSM 436]